jgi:hypothetical protein
MTTFCDMCHKPLKSVRYTITTLLRPNAKMVVGPECFRKEKKARKEMLAKHSPAEIEALRQKVAEFNCR